MTTDLAQSVDCDTTFEERELVRHNWTKLGLAYWFTDYNLEYWRAPEGGRHVILVTE